MFLNCKNIHIVLCIFTVSSHGSHKENEGSGKKLFIRSDHPPADSLTAVVDHDCSLYIAQLLVFSIMTYRIKRMLLRCTRIHSKMCLCDAWWRSWKSLHAWFFTRIQFPARASQNLVALHLITTILLSYSHISIFHIFSVTNGWVASILAW